MNRRGVTLIEVLVSIGLLSALIVGILGAFFISKMGTETARHKMAAIGIAKQYLEKEVSAGFDGGNLQGYYFSVPSNSPITVTIDDHGNLDPTDDLLGTLTPNPYPATRPALVISGTTYNDKYKIVGFVVQWTDGPKSRAYTERLTTYVAQR